MKVLMLGWELPPHNSGGLGVACLQLTKALASSGADIEFILPFADTDSAGHMKVTSTVAIGHQPDFNFLSYDSFKYVGSEDYLSAESIQSSFMSYENAVSRLIEDKEFDIIHAHDWLTFRAGLRAKQKLAIPLVVHVHSIESDRSGGHKGNPLVHEIEEQSFLLADKIIAVSDLTKKKIMQEYCIPEDKIEVIHNSIDPAMFEPLGEDNAYFCLADLKASGWQVVANIGRLTVQKGLSHLLNAAAEVTAMLPKTFFLFVGSGELRDELLLQAAELNIADRVIFTGFMRGKQWRDAYSVADLFVMPSVSEPFGLTPLEAAGYGTPSLISKQSGVSEVFKNCLRVDFWDEKEIANKIIGTLKYTSMKNELAAKAQQEYSTLSWQKSSDRLMRIYDELKNRDMVYG